MGDRTKFNEQVAADGAFSEGLQRLRGERDLAKDHIFGRNRRVAELLCYIDLMRDHNLLPANAKVSCRGAIYQDYESSAGHEAAHYLPSRSGLPEALPHTARRSTGRQI